MSGALQERHSGRSAADHAGDHGRTTHEGKLWEGQTRPFRERAEGAPRSEHVLMPRAEKQSRWRRAHQPGPRPMFLGFPECSTECKLKSG